MLASSGPTDSNRSGRESNSGPSPPRSDGRVSKSGPSEPSREDACAIVLRVWFTKGAASRAAALSTRPLMLLRVWALRSWRSANIN